MKSASPDDRTSLELRVMGFLNDQPHAHPVTVDEIIDAIDENMRYVIICAVDDLKNDGLVEMNKLRDGGLLVRLLPQGKDVLTRIYAGRTGC